MFRSVVEFEAADDVPCRGDFECPAERTNRMDGEIVTDDYDLLAVAIVVEDQLHHLLGQSTAVLCVLALTYRMHAFGSHIMKMLVLSQDNLEKKIVRIPEENRQEEKLKTT